jgi:hypothetical protein
MKKYEIHLADWQRMLFGQSPPVFLLEVLIRTIIIYVFLLFVLRWLGKRMSGQLTILEMAVMLTLGSYRICWYANSRSWDYAQYVGALLYSGVSARS